VINVQNIDKKFLKITLLLTMIRWYNVYRTRTGGDEMGKTILMAIIVAVLDCAIAAVKEIGE